MMRFDQALGGEALPREQRDETPVNRRRGLARELLVHDRLSERLKRTLQLLHPETKRSHPLDERSELGIGGAQRPNDLVRIEHEFISSASMRLGVCASSSYG